MNDAGWISFYKYFKKIGILHHNGLNKYLNYISSGIFLNVMFEKVFVASKMPTKILRDNSNRLHSIQTYAIQFKDGYGQYYVHGVFFEKNMFEKYFVKKKYEAKDILELRNAEQRTVIIQELGYEKVIAHIQDKKVMDSCNKKWNNTSKKTSYELIEFKIDTLVIRVIKVEWFEKNRKRQTILGIPLEESTKTCMGAIAWTFGMTEKEYRLSKEA